MNSPELQFGVIRNTTPEDFSPNKILAKAEIYFCYSVNHEIKLVAIQIKLLAIHSLYKLK